MNRRMLIWLAAGVYGLTVAGVVNAQQRCAPHAVILKAMAALGQVPTAAGLSSDGTITELLTAKSGDWTLLTVLKDGRACFMDVGEAWDRIEPKPAGEPI